MRTTAIVLLLAAIACWGIGCTSRAERPSEPANQPANEPMQRPEPLQPAPADETHRFAEWLAVNPMNLDMRGMWISAGMINANAGGYRDTNFDALECNADNIAQKAGKFAGMWEVIRTQNREIVVKAKASDWFEARFMSQRVFKSCTDCHVDAWSPYTRGFTPEAMEDWLKNGNAAQGADFAGAPNLTSTEEYLKLMYRMVQYLDRSIAAVDSNNLAEVLKWTKSLDEAVSEQLELWRTVERAATQIAEIASRTDTAGVESQYNRMIKACMDCHDLYVKDEREILNPLPWKQRGR